MNDVVSTPPSWKHRDRSAGLLVFGVLEMLLGGLIALAIPLMIMSQVLGAQAMGEAPPWRSIVPGLLFYGLAAVALVWLGIGSIKARRWARALILILAWSWLAVGVVTTIFTAFLMPQMLRGVAPGGEPMPETVQIAVVVTVFGFLGVMFLLLPAILVFFYQSAHVKATCAVRDPVSRWTDRCPLPVLGLSLWLACSAIVVLTMPISSNGVVPMFGTLLYDWPGVLCYLALAGLWGYAAWAIYRLEVKGWWVALITLCLAATSTVITLLRVDLWEMYERMGYSEQQIALLRQYNLSAGSVTAVLSLGTALLFVSYVLFVKRYFRRPSTEAAVRRGPSENAVQGPG